MINGKIHLMTTERYKVLGAVLALREFTVADLATFSGVKANTVRTVLAREPDLLVDVGKQETGAKGGQYTRHRIKEDALERLRSEIHELYRQIGAYVERESPKKANEKAAKYSPPMVILAAEEALIDRFPKIVERDQKIQLIDFVRTAASKQSSPASEMPGQPAELEDHREFHLSALRALIDLCSVELVCAEKPQAAAYPASTLRDFFFSLAERGSRLREQDYSSKLLSRFLMSPILGMAGHSAVSMAPESTLISALQSDEDPQAREWIQALQDVTAPAEKHASAAGRTSSKYPPRSSRSTLDLGTGQSAAAIIKESFTPGETPLSIGVETLGGVVSRMIPRYSKLPARHREVFSTAADNQTSVEVALYQGERLLARDNYKLGVFRLHGIPLAPRGVPQIEVIFEIDTRGKLTVTATNQETGNQQAIVLSVAPELSPREIEKMLRDAEDHAEEDREVQNRITLRNRADSAVAYAERSLREYGDAVPDEVRREMGAAIEEVRQAAEDGDSATVDAALAELSELHQQLYFSRASQQAMPQHEAEPQAQAQATFPNQVKVRS